MVYALRTAIADSGVTTATKDILVLGLSVGTGSKCEASFKVWVAGISPVPTYDVVTGSAIATANFANVRFQMRTACS